MKIKNILAVVCFLLSMFACTNEDELNPGGSGNDVEIGKPVTITLSLNTPNAPVVETKSGEQFGSISSLHALVYDVDKGNELKVVPLEISGSATEHTGLKLSTTTGTKRIYVIANWDSNEGSLEEEFANEANLKTWKSKNATAISTKEPSSPMLGFVDADYKASVAAYKAGTVSELVIDIDKISKNGSPLTGSLQASVVPPYSKISFSVKNKVGTDEGTIVDFKIQHVYIRNLPKRYTLFPQTKIWEVGDVDPDKNESITPKASQTNEWEFWMYENLQGEKSASSEAFKNPFDKEEDGPIMEGGNPETSYSDWEPRWAQKTPCTYIEVSGTYAYFKDTKQGAGTRCHRFFLGENTTTDFNIKRNIQYKIALVFTGFAGVDELEYEWRVQADLNEFEIIPEGEIDIDGSKNLSTPFYIINNTGQKISIIGALGYGAKYSDMMFYYQGGSGSSSDLNAEVLKHLPDKGMLKVGVSSNNLGILGSAGHGGDPTASVNDYYRYLGTGTTTYKASDNIDPTIKSQVVNGEIYRIRKYELKSDGKVSKTFNVKEYPLLCLTDAYGFTDANTVLGQRIDRTSDAGAKLMSYSEAVKICPKQGSIVEGYLSLCLPSKADLKLMMDQETGPLAPPAGQCYWAIDEGESHLYEWPTMQEHQVDNSSKGFLRCVYKRP